MEAASTQRLTGGRGRACADLGSVAGLGRLELQGLGLHLGLKVSDLQLEGVDLLLQLLAVRLLGHTLEMLSTRGPNNNCSRSRSHCDPPGVSCDLSVLTLGFLARSFRHLLFQQTRGIIRVLVTIRCGCVTLSY